MTEPPEYPPPTPYAEQPPAPIGPGVPGSWPYPPPPPPLPPSPWHYAQPGWQQAPPVPAGTNPFAIGALVTAILGTLCFSSIVLGIVALVQIGRTKQKGKGLAITALVISGLWLVGGVTLGVVDAVNSQNDQEQARSAAIAGSDDVSIEDLTVGDCLITGQFDEDGSITSLPSVPCSERHDSEVYAILQLTGTEYPGDDALGESAEKRCDREFDRVLPKDVVEDHDISTFLLYPTEDGWADGDRAVTCMATSDDLRTGSLRN